MADTTAERHGISFSRSFRLLRPWARRPRGILRILGETAFAALLVAAHGEAIDEGRADAAVAPIS